MEHGAEGTDQHPRAIRTDAGEVRIKGGLWGLVPLSPPPHPSALGSNALLGLFPEGSAPCSTLPWPLSPNGHQTRAVDTCHTCWDTVGKQRVTPGA